MAEQKNRTETEKIKQTAQPKSDANDYGYTKMRKAAMALYKIESNLSDADPEWMLYTSSEYTELKAGVARINKWVKNESELLKPGVNRNSARFMEDAKLYDKLLDASMHLSVKYLEKKQRDFDKNGERKEDPARQQWEQKRIRTVLHSFDKLFELKGSENLTEREKERKNKVEEFKQNLLSEKSKAIFNKENQPKKSMAK